MYCESEFSKYYVLNPIRLTGRLQSTAATKIRFVDILKDFVIYDHSVCKHYWLYVLKFYVQ
jgi:hypothetical protein